MPTRDELLALADRVQREQPSREIDRAIAEAAGLKPFTSGEQDGESVFIDWQSNGRLVPLPYFTSNRDAAASLFPAGFTAIEVRSHDALGRFVCDISRLVEGTEQIVSGRAATEPQARCSAALRGLAETLP